jgi:hypothetical protein
VTSEPRSVRSSPVGMDLGDWRRGAPAHGRSLVAIGLGVIVSLVLVGLSMVAGAFALHTVSGALFNGRQGQMRSGSAAASQQSLKVQSTLVEQRRAAVAAYAAMLTEFKIATSRPPGAVGINLDAKEATRRDGVLTGLVLDCIDAVDRYNLAAQARSATQLQSAGLPAGYAWRVDCAPGQ